MPQSSKIVEKYENSSRRQRPWLTTERRLLANHLQYLVSRTGLSRRSYSHTLIKCHLCMCLHVSDVNQGSTEHTGTCNLVCTDLLMNPDRTPKTRSVWPTLMVKIPARGKKWARIGIFKPAELTTACFAISWTDTQTYRRTNRRHQKQHPASLICRVMIICIPKQILLMND